MGIWHILLGFFGGSEAAGVVYPSHVAVWAGTQHRVKPTDTLQNAVALEQTQPRYVGVDS